MSEERSHPRQPAIRIAGLIGFVLVLLCGLALFFDPGAAAAAGPSNPQAGSPGPAALANRPAVQGAAGRVTTGISEEPPGPSLKPPDQTGGNSGAAGTSLNAAGASPNAVGAYPNAVGAYPPPEISVADITVLEGDSGLVQAVFTIIRTGYLEIVSAVNFATSDGLAAQPADYNPHAGTLIFDRTVASMTVTVDVNGDTLDELDEDFFLDLSLPAEAVITDSQAVCTITDDDPLPEISIADVTVTETDSGTTTATFNLTLNAPSGKIVTVEFSTADDSAAQPGDYLPGSGMVTFLPGDVAGTLDVAVVGDILDEDDEIFLVNLSNPANALLTDSQAQGTISDDDLPPEISIQDVTVAEGNSGITSAAFSVTLSAPSSKTVTVDFATADDTAAQPADYLPASGTLTFLPGDTSESLDIDVLGDTLAENDEAFLVDLSSPLNGTLADSQAQGTITDDDLLPEISIQDITIAEGNSGTSLATFTVILASPSGKTISLDYATADGSAAQPGDYLPASGTLTFLPGDTSEDINVSVAGDTLDEPDETFLVNLSNAVNASLPDSQAQGTITDDDLLPTISIQDLTVTEGNSGTSLATFTVALSAPSSKTISVDFTSADGTASQPADYLPASGSLTFLPGDTSEEIDVSVAGDTLDEPDETFLLDLSNPINAALPDSQAQGTITDDDLPPTISIQDVTVTEGNSGLTAATFNLQLSAASGKTVTVEYASADGTAHQPADYLPASETVTFTPGDVAETITIQVVGDILDEPDEAFLVDFANPLNATLPDNQAQGTISDDDLPPALSIQDISAVEGDSGTSQAVFTVSLSAPSGKMVSVNFATSNGTAAQPLDYLETAGTLTFLPGDTSENLSVSIVGDAIDEADETYLVNLTIPTNASISDNQATGIISDDDAPPSISIADLSVAEGDSGTTAAIFTVSLSSPSGRAISVNYATSNGTASQPADYLPASGTLTFAAGDTAETVHVNINGDLLDEYDETFLVNLGSATFASLQDGQGQGTILDDDLPPHIMVDDVTVVDGVTSNVLATFLIRLDAPSAKTISVDFATLDGSAIAPGDYIASTGTATFSPGETQNSVSITVIGSTALEPEEYFYLYLSEAVNAFLADNQATGTILEQYLSFLPIVFKTEKGHWYHPPSVSVSDVTVIDGYTANVTASFTVSLNNPTDKTVTVEYSTQNDTATAPDDYLSAMGTLTFPPGQSTLPVEVTVIGSLTPENPERFLIYLREATNAVLEDSQGAGTILKYIQALPVIVKN